MKLNVSINCGIQLKVVKETLYFTIGNRLVEALHLRVGPTNVIVEGVHYRVKTTGHMELVSVSLLKVLHIVGYSCGWVEVAFLVVTEEQPIRQLVIH
jgi:hypothetical protein